MIDAKLEFSECLPLTQVYPINTVYTCVALLTHVHKIDKMSDKAWIQLITEFMCKREALLYSVAYYYVWPVT